MTALQSFALGLVGGLTALFAVIAYQWVLDFVERRARRKEAR